MKILDLHSHILPGFDDGASSEEESLRMLTLAAKQGVRAVVATSHASMQFPVHTPEEIKAQCRLLEEKAKQRLGEDFRIYPGQEIFYSDNILERLQEQQLLTLGESAYVLVEFHPATPYSVIYKGVRQLLMAQYLPVIAHIERCSALRQKGRVEELIEAGARMQMNYRQIGEKWYAETTRWCRKMLKEGNVHFLGTDMHNMKSRKPMLEEALRWLEKYLDEEYIEEICCSNAEKILKNERI